jgi:CHAT domain-containing protein
MAMLGGRMKEADNYYAAAKRVRSGFIKENPVDYITSLLRYVDKSIITRNYTEAEQLCQEAKAVMDTTVGTAHELYPAWLFTTASVYANVGRSKQTGEFLAEAVEAARKYSPQDTARYCKFLTAYGVWQQGQGQYDHAENSFLEAQQLLKAMDDTLTTEFVSLLGNIGAVYSAQQEFEKAEPFFKNALLLAGDILGTNHLQYAVRQFHYGYVLFAQGKFAEAHELFKTSSATFYRIVPAVMRNSYEFPQYLGMSHWAMGAHDESEKEFLKANSIMLRVIHENFPAMSEKEKTLFWESVQGWFQKYNFITISRSHERPLALGDMYTWQLATKAILLNSSKKVKERIFKNGDKILIGLYNDWLLKKEELTKLYSMTGDSLEAQITRAETDVNSLEKKLSEISQTFASARDKKEATWADVRAALKPGEAAVEIIRIQGMTKEIRYNDTIYYAALIVTPETKKAPQLVLLKNGAELETDFLKSYQNRIRQKLSDADSYGAFWAEIDSVLKNYGTIYLSADGVYNQINLNTLLKPDGKFVAEEKDIRLVTNTKDILSKENKPLLKKQKAELFGFPKYDLSADDHSEAVLAYAAERDRSRDSDFSDFEELSRAGISELPGTKTEVENVSEIIAGNQTQVGKFLAEESLEEAVKSVENPYILHIATHGFFLSDPDKMKGGKIFGMERSRATENPLLRSGLLFAGATNTITGKQTNTMLDDGILTAYEAMNLNLDNTELVVLSACETGLGEVKNGEGVYGLQRAFQVAGAKTLIMSLWKVNDEATQELMTTFYKNWLGGMDKHAAFKSAQFSLKNKYKHPYFWGAFVMVGN